MLIRTDMIAVYVVRPDAGGASHEFLQLRRAADDFMGGTWQTVRGKIDPGETAAAAALRELREETGLVPRAFHRLSALETFYLPGPPEAIFHSVGFCAQVERADGIALNREHDAARWVARDGAADAFMWASERPLIADLCRNILDGGPAGAYLRVESDPKPDPIQ